MLAVVMSMSKEEKERWIADGGELCARIDIAYTDEVRKRGSLNVPFTSQADNWFRLSAREPSIIF
jgi:hypothetical protein